MTRCLCLLAAFSIPFLVTGLRPAAAAQGVESIPGYVDFDSASFQQEATVDLSVDAAQLAVLREEASDHNPELAAMMSDLRAFRLRQYSEPEAQTEASALALIQRLEDTGWAQVAAGPATERQVRIYARPHGNSIAGLAVIAIEAGKEVSIANVVGRISPEALERLGLPIPR